MKFDYFFKVQALVMNVRRQCINEYWERLGGEDPLEQLSKRQRSCLFGIFQFRACSLQQVRELNGLSASAASTAVDKMVRAGILCREQNAQNRRKVNITVAPKIAVHLQAIEKKYRKKVAALLSKNCAAELQLLETAAEKICNALTNKGE